MANSLGILHQRYEDEAVTLVRTRKGRSLSRDRYESAEIAFTAMRKGFFARDVRVTLHQAGTVTKLALCAHLLDVGVADAWAAAHIRQDIAKALAYANATGLGHNCPDLARLAVILSPYWKWGYPHLIGDPPMDDGGFAPDRVRPLVAALLARVADVTGHARPMGCEHPQGEARP
ncbi:hypothetical protein [Novosphingobium sp. AP12]|uniref:hypothetical protein n=1 Tax=Novosphingobium sp. AP12 TaxID=1144305 RepID=UPI0012F98AD7|nr:hypothetical protein [Novosphingobium sp. AP12]